MALMNFLERRATEKSFLDNPKEWLLAMFGGRSVAGVDVTATTAMKVGAVYACVRILAETVGSLPMPVYKRRKSGGKDKATDHPLYDVLHLRPNDEQTAVEWRSMKQGHMALRGNGHSQIIRDNGGRVVALWPLHPDRVRVKRDTTSKRLVYLISQTPISSLNPSIGPTSTGTVTLDAEEVLHLRGLMSDGVNGLSPIQVAQDTFGVAIAQQEFNAKFFVNGATPPSALKFPGNLSKEKRTDLRNAINEQVGGLAGAHRFLLLEGGLEWQNLGMTMRDAQFIQGAQLSIRDVARIFRIQPHKIGDLDQATFSNIEQQAIEFVTDSIRPWAVVWEQACTLRLLTERERAQGYFIELNLEGLLRGDLKARYESYAIARQWGWLSADDIRALENMNELPEGKGQIYLEPMNMVEAGEDPAAAPAPKRPDKKLKGDVPPDADDDERTRRLRELEEDVIARAVRREAEAIRAAAPKHASPEAWRTWVDAYYVRHAAFISEALKIDLAHAQGYARTHRAALLAEGLDVVTTWEQTAAADLRALANLEGAAA